MTVAPSVENKDAGSTFRPELQGLRALAVVLVVAFHTNNALPGGFVGVDVFFVLSGFLIVRLLDREAERTGTLDLRLFFARRARRLLPAVAVVSMGTLIASVAVMEIGAPLRTVTRTAVAASVFVANAVLYREADYFAPSAERNPLLHMWSLAVEEQFYFLAPAALLFASMLIRGVTKSRAEGLRRKSWITFLVLGSTFSLALSVFLVDLEGSLPYFGAPMSWAFFSPVTRAWQFGVGGAAGLLMAERQVSAGVVRSWAPGFGVILIVASAVGLTQESPFPGLRAIVPTLGALLVVLSASPHVQCRTKTFLSARPVQSLGDVSYSWYLWHWPFIVLAREALGESALVAVAAVGASLVVAYATKYGVEDRFRYGSQYLGRGALKLAFVCVLVPLITALSLRVANEIAYSREQLGLSARSWSHAACFLSAGEEIDVRWPSEDCTTGLDVQTSSIDVLLLGDSHADALADGVRAATESLGLSLGVWTASAHPPVGESLWTAQLEGLVNEAQPLAVVLSARSLLYVQSEGRRERWLSTEANVVSEGLSVEELWVRELRLSVERFRESGAGVVWVQNPPEFDEVANRSRPTLLLPNRSGVLSQIQLAEQRGQLLLAERAQLSLISRVGVVDPALVVCQPICQNKNYGKFLYYDDNHLSPFGSLLLAERIAEAIESVR